MKKCLFFILIFLTRSIYSQIIFDDVKGVWNYIDTLYSSPDDELKPIKVSDNFVTYAAWPTSIFIWKKNYNYFRIQGNGGYDDIIFTYISGDMLILEVENKCENTKGKLGIVFINKDTIRFKLISGTISTLLYFDKNEIFVRAPTVLETK
jgi:hypothetical protein